MIVKTCMPNGGQLPLVFACKLRIHPFLGRYSYVVLAAIVFVLFFEKSRFQHDVTGCNRVTPQLLRYLFYIIKAERFVWTAIVQLFTFIGIDVVHHSEDIFLCKIIHTDSFRNHTPNQLMVYLTGSFLIRTARITIVDTCPAKTCILNIVVPVLNGL